MKTKKLLFVLACILCIANFVGCSNKDKLVGVWICQDLEGVEKDNSNTWPNHIALNEDGTGKGRGLTLNWKEQHSAVFKLNWSEQDGKLLKLSINMKEELTYNYSFKGNMLYLDGHPYKKSNIKDLLKNYENAISKIEKGIKNQNAEEVIKWKEEAFNLSIEEIGIFLGDLGPAMSKEERSQYSESYRALEKRYWDALDNDFCNSPDFKKKLKEFRSKK